MYLSGLNSHGDFWFIWKKDEYHARKSGFDPIIVEDSSFDAKKEETGCLVLLFFSFDDDKKDDGQTREG